MAGGTIRRRLVSGFGSDAMCAVRIISGHVGMATCALRLGNTLRMGIVFMLEVAALASNRRMNVLLEFVAGVTMARETKIVRRGRSGG